MLVNTVTDLDNVRTNLGGTYALGGDIDATGTSGFTPIGNDNGPVASFRGLFDGQNWTISGLTIDASSGVAGLFGFNSGTIQNVNLVNVTVAATKDGQVLGGLVGHNEASGTISNVSVSGTVGGLFNSLLSGGLVGLNNGTISDSYALANVSGGGMSRRRRAGRPERLLWRRIGCDHHQLACERRCGRVGRTIGCGRTGRQKHVWLNHYRFIRQRRRHRLRHRNGWRIHR